MPVAMSHPRACVVVFLVALMCAAFSQRACAAKIIVTGGGGRFSDAVRTEVADMAGKQLRELEEFYGYTCRRPVKVFLFTDEKAFEREAGADVPEWAVAIAQPGAVYMRRAGTNFGSPQFESTLKHELSHVLLDEMFAGKPGALPRWLDEGLAVYVSGEWEMPEAWTQSKTELYAALRSGKSLDFNEISDSFPLSDWKARVAYAQSYHFVAFMMKRYKRDGVVSLLNRLAAGEEFRRAFKESMGADFDETVQYWREKVAGKGGFALLLIGINGLDYIIWTFMALLVVAGFVRYLVRRKRGIASSLGGGDYYDDDEEDDPLDDWDEDSMGYKPWRPGREKKDKD